jgi:pantoate--beta-alanine ligase
VKVCHNIIEFRPWRRSIEGALLVPFVPTMGALHDGHASLVRQARQIAGAQGKVAASIFVNPTQFRPGEDFNKYPRTLEADLKILEAAGCDGVFVPSAQEMYPPHLAKTRETRDGSGGVSIDPGDMTNVLEGAIRPGHFRGVCTVVAKLLNITEPTHLLLGQKDFQQQAILRRMCADLNMPVKVVTCTTVREPDGLAMSSRNRYLSAEERSRATALYEALTWVKGQYDGGVRRPLELEAGMRSFIEARGLTLQYAIIVEPESLCRWQDIGAGEIAGDAVALIAAKLGATRLIDNMVLTSGSPKQNP